MYDPESLNTMLIPIPERVTWHAKAGETIRDIMAFQLCGPSIPN